MKDHLAIYSKIICHGWCGFIISCWWQKLQRLLSFVLYSHACCYHYFFSIFQLQLEKIFLTSLSELLFLSCLANGISLSSLQFSFLWQLNLSERDQFSPPVIAITSLGSNISFQYLILFNIWFCQKTISTQKYKLLNKTPIYYLYYSLIHTLNWKLFRLEICIETH